MVERHDRGRIPDRGPHVEALCAKPLVELAREGHGVPLDVGDADLQEVVEPGPELIDRTERHGGVSVLPGVFVNAEAMTA